MSCRRRQLWGEAPVKWPSIIHQNRLDRHRRLPRHLPAEEEVLLCFSDPSFCVWPAAHASRSTWHIRQLIHSHFSKFFVFSSTLGLNGTCNLQLLGRLGMIYSHGIGDADIICTTVVGSLVQQQLLQCLIALTVANSFSWLMLVITLLFFNEERSTNFIVLFALLFLKNPLGADKIFSTHTSPQYLRSTNILNFIALYVLLPGI